MHDNCKDVVSGQPLVCGAARQDERMCGFDGKYFEALEEEATIIT